MSSPSLSDKKNVQDKRRLAVGLEEFASGPKGEIRAIHEYNKRKEKRHVQKASMYRKYKKAMKKEGYQVVPSRKRKQSDEKEQGDATAATPPRKKAPFDIHVKRAQKKQKQQQEWNDKRAEMEAKEKQQAKRQKERQSRAKRLSKRTKRGQPVMKHVIHDMLHKLEKQHPESQTK